MIPAGFHRPKRGERCPVCGRKDWCLVSDDGARALCKRMPSQAQWKDAGWLHVIGKSWPRPTTRPAAEPVVSGPELSLMARQYRTAVNPQRVERLADSLGLTASSLYRLDVGWSVKHRAWAFPMTDAAGKVRGIRLRTDDGRKFSVKGGREGLFVPRDLGPSALLVCEGPTSCAALLDLGFDAVGRPSCTGGGELLCGLLRQRRRDVVIFGDHDTEKTRPDGSTFRPGQDGAERLAAEVAALCRSVKVVIPPNAKDARDWKNAGATRAVIEAVIRAQPYRRRAG